MTIEKKSPKIVIESDGTSSGTVVKVDGVAIDNIQSVKFEAKMKKDLATLNLTYVYPQSVIVNTTGDNNA